MTETESQTIYERLKYSLIEFDEVLHCNMILRIMADPKKARFSAFCVAASISEDKFYDWLKKSEIFLACYALGKMYSRECWEKEGAELRDEICMPGTSNYKFEYWRMMGWSRFGIGKNSRIRLDLDPNATPEKHYGQLIQQASTGAFTAGEIKQLMEAINVGLNTHQVFKLQAQIDELKSDLATMSENSDGHNISTNQRIAQKD